VIDSKISKQILTVAPEYKGYRGGIGAIVNAYSCYFSPFHFIATYPKAKTKYKLGSLPLYLYAYCRIALKLFLNNDIKLVHIHVAPKGSFYRKYGVFLLVKYVFKKKVVFHSHGGGLKDFYLKNNRITKRMFEHFVKGVDSIICLSPQWRSFYEMNFNVKNTIILENIVERPKIDTPFTQKTSVSFLFLGFIGKNKGIYDLIDVIYQNKLKLAGKAKFYIGGNGEVERIIDLIEKYRLQETVEFIGWVDGTKKNRVLSSSDVYLLPSYKEGLPVSILEAMSYSKPIISTNVGGIPEIVHDGRNGYLISPGDKLALWKSIKYFIEYPDSIGAMGEISRKLVEPYFSDNVIAKLETVYAKVLQDDSGS